MDSAQAKQAKPRTSASDRIVRDITVGLYEGRFVPGQRLVEPDLMEQYAVSRPTVREAVQRLAAQGIVDVSHGKSARIRQLSVQEGLNILQIIEVIVGLAARLAAQNIDHPGAQEDLALALSALMETIASEDRAVFMRARNRFHRTMARIGGNPDLERILTGMQVHVLRNRLVMPPAERAASYRRIGEAIAAGDPEAAETAARQHVQRMMSALSAEVPRQAQS